MTAPPAVFLPPVMSDVVIDISHHQNVSQDFSAASASGIKAVILKATQGTGFVDHTFLPRVVEARAAGSWWERIIFSMARTRLSKLLTS